MSDGLLLVFRENEGLGLNLCFVMLMLDLWCIGGILDKFCGYYMVGLEGEL